MAFEFAELINNLNSPKRDVGGAIFIDNSSPIGSKPAEALLPQELNFSNLLDSSAGVINLPPNQDQGKSFENSDYLNLTN
jgi:hypothetical protein